MSTFNLMTDTTDLTAAELRLYEMLMAADGKVVEWKWESAWVWAKTLSVEPTAEMWVERMSAVMSVEDVPSVDNFMDVEMLMWDVINMSVGSVTQEVWEEAVVWVTSEMPEVAQDEMMSDEPPAETQKLWEAWKRGE